MKRINMHEVLQRFEVKLAFCICLNISQYMTKRNFHEYFRLLFYNTLMLAPVKPYFPYAVIWFIMFTHTVWAALERINAFRPIRIENSKIGLVFHLVQSELNIYSLNITSTQNSGECLYAPYIFYYSKKLKLSVSSCRSTNHTAYETHSYRC